MVLARHIFNQKENVIVMPSHSSSWPPKPCLCTCSSREGWTLVVISLFAKRTIKATAELLKFIACTPIPGLAVKINYPPRFNPPFLNVVVVTLAEGDKRFIS